MNSTSSNYTEFKYKAYDSHRRIHKGSLSAVNIENAAASLRNQNLIPVNLTPVGKTGWNTEINLSSKSRIKAKDLSPAFLELAAMYKAGLPITKSLEAVQHQTESEALKEIFRDIRVAVALGMPLSLAMSEHSKIFDALAINLIRVGEETGFLDIALQDLAKTYETDSEIREKIRSSTTYPKVVGSMTLVIVAALIVFVVPVFENMFSNLNSELPAATQFLVFLSRNFYWILPLIAVIIISLYFGWKAFAGSKNTKLYADRFKLSLPILGKVQKHMIIARVMRALALMTKVGVPILDALNIARDLSNNKVFEEAFDQIEHSITSGRGIAAPMAASGLFPPMVYNLVAVGEDSGQLPQMLTQVANFFEAEVKYKVERLSSTIEPLMLGALGLLVGGIVISLYLPTFTMYSQLG